MRTMPMIRSLIPPFASPLRMIGALKRFVADRRGRRAVIALAECDDHLLADIGVERADLALVFERPMTSDPSAHLALIAEARRRR